MDRELYRSVGRPHLPTLLSAHQQADARRSARIAHRSAAILRRSQYRGSTQRPRTGVRSSSCPGTSRCWSARRKLPTPAIPARTAPSQEEIEYLLRTVTQLFPKAKLSAHDIKYAFAGVRPLPNSPGNKPSAVTRRHFLHDHSDDGADRLISVIGGKLTTAASLARECARKIGLAVAEPTSSHRRAGKFARSHARSGSSSRSPAPAR